MLLRPRLQIEDLHAVPGRRHAVQASAAGRGGRAPSLGDAAVDFELPTPPAPRPGLPAATFNLRGVMDRWQERKPLLRQCLQQIDADVLCFQECLTGGVSE